MALDFVAGCIGGCAGVVVGHPFDTIKVQMQTQDPRRPTYHGTFHCMQSIIQHESVLGLYRGMSSPVCGVALINAVIFGVYGNTQRRLSDPESLKAHFLAGASAGLAQSFICSPIELAKIHIQVQSQMRGAERTGPLKCLTGVFRRRGLRGLFRGLTSTAARDSTGVAIYFVSYEVLSRSVTEYPGQQLSTPTILLVGGLAGTLSWLSSFPVDVIKTRLQADGMSNSSYRYKGFWDCYRQSVRSEGYSFLSRGLFSTLLRAFPTNAATFAVVTWVFRLAGVDSRAKEAETVLGTAGVQSGELLLRGAPLLLGAAEPLYEAFLDRQLQLRKLIHWPSTPPEKLTECFQVFIVPREVTVADILREEDVSSSFHNKDTALSEGTGVKIKAVEDTKESILATNHVKGSTDSGVSKTGRENEEGKRTSDSDSESVGRNKTVNTNISPEHRPNKVLQI